jgi:predicted amino acid racemase
VRSPRLEVDLEAVRHNARHLVGALDARGIRVVGVTKAVVAWPAVAAALLEGGAVGLGDSRIENLRALGPVAPRTLIRSPMLSQVDDVVRHAERSLNTEWPVLEALSTAAVALGVDHDIVVMVELGDLREGVAVADVVALARAIRRLPGLSLHGLGANLACQSGVVPDQSNMGELSRLADDVEQACGVELASVSGGNSASLGWALSATDVGRVDELRLGEAILLGVDPLDRRPIEGLRLDAFAVVAEVIEVKTKPVEPWGTLAQGAFGVPTRRRSGGGTARQAIVALGRQDVDPDGLTPASGITVTGASSDHLVLDVGDHDVTVGDELRFGPDYSALLRAATSPFVAKVESVLPSSADPLATTIR